MFQRLAAYPNCRHIFRAFAKHFPCISLAGFLYPNVAFDRFWHLLSRLEQLAREIATKCGKNNIISSRWQHLFYCPSTIPPPPKQQTKVISILKCGGSTCTDFYSLVNNSAATLHVAACIVFAACSCTACTAKYLIAKIFSTRRVDAGLNQGGGQTGGDLLKACQQLVNHNLANKM